MAGRERTKQSLLPQLSLCSTFAHALGVTLRVSSRSKVEKSEEHQMGVEQFRNVLFPTINDATSVTLSGTNSPQ